MTEEQLSGFFKNLSRKTNIKCSAHRFRHRLATDLVNQKGNIKDVQQLLEHSNVKTTLKTTTPIKSRKPCITIVPDEPAPAANR